MKKQLIAALLLTTVAANAADQWTYSKSEILVESGYVWRFSGSFNEPQEGIVVGVGYSLTPNLVVGVRGVSYLDDPQGVNELAGRVTYRAPLSFLSNKLAPYAFTEGGCGLQSGIGFGGAGGGIEWRPFWKNIGVYGEADVRVTTEWTSSVGVSGGLRLNF
jgi:hypothetical protein